MAQKLERPKETYGRLSLLIDGKWKESKTENYQSVFDPGKGEVIAQVPFTLEEEVNEAVESSQRAFEEWKEQPVTDRVKYLFKIKNVLEEHAEELAAVNTQNHGKTVEESRGDVKRTIENVDAAIAVAYILTKGEKLEQIAHGIDEETVKEPLGVFAITSPFNFPLMVPFWFIPYAIVLGDTVVVKPSEIDPVPVARALFLIQKETGLPPGVINMVHGAREVVESLIAHKDVKGVTFVGSTPVAKYVYKLAGEHGKRAIANGGAKNSVVVMPDADLDRSISSITSSFFGNAGQRCLAGSNLVAVGSIKHDVVDKFSKSTKDLKIGYGFNEGVDMGPVVSKTAKERIIGNIERGILEDKAKVVTDGRSFRSADYPEGFYLGPTIFDEVSADMSIAKDEIFGPVASILPTSNLDEAIELINTSTNYGNMACIYTSSGRSAREFSRRINAGNIGVNLGVAAPAGYFPFGGRRDSFFGVLHAQIDTVDFFTDKKVIISRW
jgi:malonate-semialdehyde dehydrogenase (acetylating)/methylmalonate-semialdehyde dehydrogenase